MFGLKHKACLDWNVCACVLLGFSVCLLGPFWLRRLLSKYFTPLSGPVYLIGVAFLDTDLHSASCLYCGAAHKVHTRHGFQFLETWAVHSRALLQGQLRLRSPAKDSEVVISNYLSICNPVECQLGDSDRNHAGLTVTSRTGHSSSALEIHMKRVRSLTFITTGGKSLYTVFCLFCFLSTSLNKLPTVTFENLPWPKQQAKHSPGNSAWQTCLFWVPSELCVKGR